MKENLKDILSHLHSEVDQETLLKYLQGKLSADEQHELEMNLLDDPFEADAAEGLAAMENKQNIPLLVNQLNRELKKKTERQKKWSFRREAKLESWMLVAIVLILLLAVIGYLVIHYMVR
jgi:flagellar biosynthesis chaperone FliJ